MKIKNKVLRIIGFLLIISLCAGILGGCKMKVDLSAVDEMQFDLFMDEYFADWVQTDTISMNYYLADPESLGIERPDATYGDIVSAELIQESKQETQDLIDRLNSFKFESLRSDQQIVYEILSRNIELYNMMEREEDYAYYMGYIRPLNGIQVQLPILLAEFSFYTADDIDRYLDLLEDTRRYFDDIIEFERERSRRGFFLSEANVDSVTEQIESYLENREDNLLITVFDDRIDSYEGLSAQQREQYKQRNRELVLGNVLPAYDTLLAAMQELRGVGARQGGLSTLPGGKEFAHSYIRLRVGTDRSAEELQTLLRDWIDMTWFDIIHTLQNNIHLYDKLFNDTMGEIADGTPEDYIADLHRNIAADFPPIAPTRLMVLEVHESLQEHMSPAFYLSPAVDRFNDNVVYVNPSSINDNLFMYTVLAHESYPGHMYQTVYFLQQSPHPIRVALSNSGYSEGWATYSEMKSYSFTDIDPAEASIAWNFRCYDMLLGAYIDLGVNVFGWDYNDVYDFFVELDLNLEAVEPVFNSATGIPLNSIMYAVGYIELTMLLEDTERAMGRDFNLMDFHRFFLEFGSAPYPIIRAHLEARIKENPSEALILPPAA